MHRIFKFWKEIKFIYLLKRSSNRSLFWDEVEYYRNHDCLNCIHDKLFYTWLALLLSHKTLAIDIGVISQIIQCLQKLFFYIFIRCIETEKNRIFICRDMWKKIRGQLVSTWTHYFVISQGKTYVTVFN